TSVDVEKVELQNTRTGHNVVLGLDHIHSFLSDPRRDSNGQKYGFLQLRSQLSLLPQGLEVEPLAPGDWGSPNPAPQYHPDALRPMPLVADRLQALISDFYRQPHQPQFGEIVELVYLMGEVDSTGTMESNDSFFMFQRGESAHGETMEVQIWMYRDSNGVERP